MAAACACEAPFLWLLLGTVGASELRAGRARPLLIVGGPSGKLPIAGVEGLLARPLLVVVTCCTVVVGVAVGVWSCRASSSVDLTELSFLGAAVVAEEGVGARSF